MKTMKRLIAVMLMLTLALLCVACGQAGTNPSTTTKGQEPSNQTPSSSTTTPTTTKALATHIVQVLDQDGNPVAGLPIQFCDDAGCRSPKVTDAAGIVEFIEPNSTNAKVRIFPEEEGSVYPMMNTEYTIDVMDGMTAEGYMKYDGTTNTIVLTVTKVAE